LWVKTLYLTRKAPVRSYHGSEMGLLFVMCN
jgi:hypothetical protein